MLQLCDFFARSCVVYCANAFCVHDNTSKERTLLKLSEWFDIIVVSNKSHGGFSDEKKIGCTVCRYNYGILPALHGRVR